MADSAAAAPMTIDFLRARLLSERSVSRASKERADQLATRVAELEEQVRALTAQRRQAEREAAGVLAILESKGFCGSLSDTLDSGSENEEAEEPRPRDAETAVDDAARSHGEEERDQEPAAEKGEAGDDATSGTAPQPGGLSWKGRSVSPRKARQLKQRHRRSYVYLLAGEDPSPKYRMGQSCRKNKRKELSSGRLVAPEEGGDAVVTESRKGQRDGSADYTDDGRAELDGEVGGDERSSGDGSGQYVIRYKKDGEMERVLEKQAELIGQYEAEERAQRDWEKKFNDNRSSPKGGVLQGKSSGRTLSIDQPPENTSEEYPAQAQRRDAGEEHGHGRAQNAVISAQGDANSDGCPSQNTNSATSGHKSSPSSDTFVSKVSDWSSSRFHDHTDDQLDTPSCLVSSNASNVDVESVLQALQRARISLQQKLGRPLPPSQVTLALPAPGDEYRTEEDLYHDGSGSSPCRQEMLALPAPEDYHSCHGSAGLSVDGADTSSLTEKRSSSSSPRQEILALSAPDDHCNPGEREDDVDMKIPVCSPGLFRLPTDSFLEDEMLSRSNGRDLEELRLRETARRDAYRDDGDAGVLAKQFYDPPHGSAPASGRCSVPPNSGFTIEGASLLSGIPGLPEDLRRTRSLGVGDLFMQRACDYSL